MMVICKNTNNATKQWSELQNCTRALEHSIPADAAPRSRCVTQTCHFLPKKPPQKKVNWLWRSQLLCCLVLSGVLTRFAWAKSTRSRVRDPACPWVTTQQWVDGGEQHLLSFSENRGHEKSLTEWKCSSRDTARIHSGKKKTPHSLLLPVTQLLNNNTSASANTQDENESTIIQMYKVNICAFVTQKKTTQR